MFWRVTTFTPLSPIEAILDKEEFTLDELLNEEDIIQECNLGNPKVLEQLLWYLTETPEDDLHFKYSYTACEIFCCELDDVLSNLITSDDLMERLFSPLNKPPPLNSTLAGYFGRVVGCLLVKRAPDTHKWLAAHPAVLPALVRHVDTTSTVEVILRLVGADEIASAGGPSTASEWLSSTNLMDQLLDTLVAPKERAARAARIQRAAQQNVGEILVHVARHQCAPMISQLTAPAYLSRMLEAAAAPESEVLKVAIALLSPRVPSPAMSPPPLALGLMPSYEQPMEQPSKADVQAVAVEVIRFIPHLTGMLQRPSPTAVESQELPYGILTPPLGRQRITVIELGQALLATNESVAVRAMLDSEFIPRAMDLFQQYPYNSILHSNVLDMLVTLIDALTPSQVGPDGHLIGPTVNAGAVGNSRQGQDPGELLGGAAGGPPVVGGAMGETQEFLPSLGPGFDFSTPNRPPADAELGLTTSAAPDSSIDSSSAAGAVEASSAELDNTISEGDAAVPDGTVSQAADEDKAPAAATTAAGSPEEVEGDADVSMASSADDGDDEAGGDADGPSPPPPPPQRNIVRPGSIGGPPATAAAGGVESVPGIPVVAEGVAVAEGAESAAVDSDAATMEADDTETTTALEDEETIEVGDDQTILECLLDKVNIIGWLLKLNSSSDAERSFFQPHKDSKIPLRAAYHGHLTQLAAKLQASKHGLLQATLDMNRDWQSFKTAYLDKQLHLEDRNSWEVDLPAEHSGPDDLTDPGACQMDVYSQADFDNTEAAWRMQLLQGDMFNGVPMAGRYTLDDDEDEYADADLSMFDEDGNGMRGMRGAVDTEGGGPHSHTIDAGGGIMSHEGDDAQLAAAVRAGGFGSSVMMGRGDHSGGPGGLIDQMAGLGLGVMEAPAVDDDDEVVMGGQDEEPGFGIGLGGGPTGPHTHSHGHTLQESGIESDAGAGQLGPDAASELIGTTDAVDAAVAETVVESAVVDSSGLSSDAAAVEQGEEGRESEAAGEGEAVLSSSAVTTDVAAVPAKGGEAAVTADSSRDGKAADVAVAVPGAAEETPVVTAAAESSLAGAVDAAAEAEAAPEAAEETPVAAAAVNSAADVSTSAGAGVAALMAVPVAVEAREVPSHRVEAEAVTVGIDDGNSR